MTDLEMIRLAAEAMGISHSWTDRVVYLGTGAWDLETSKRYDPLHDDAQAMALVKKFNISLIRDDRRTGECEWTADGDYVCSNADLNRAIVECVAKMQAAK